VENLREKPAPSTRWRSTQSGEASPATLRFSSGCPRWRRTTRPP